MPRSCGVRDAARVVTRGGEQVAHQSAAPAGRTGDLDAHCPLLLHRLVAELTNSAVASNLVPVSINQSKVVVQENTQSSEIRKSRPLSVKRWRSAEQQILDLLMSQGWKVEDVSRQNIGYDIEGESPEGDEASIEVKSIGNIGQPFVLTSNEEAVARQKGDAYLIALVRQTDTHLEVAFIRNPTKTLEFTRQCRQWVWECSSYDFRPERFPIE